MEKMLLLSESDFVKAQQACATAGKDSLYKPESYPVIFLYELFDNPNSSYDFVSFEYVYPEDFNNNL